MYKVSELVRRPLGPRVEAFWRSLSKKAEDKADWLSAMSSWETITQQECPPSSKRASPFSTLPWVLWSTLLNAPHASDLLESNLIKIFSNRPIMKWEVVFKINRKTVLRLWVGRYAKLRWLHFVWEMCRWKFQSTNISQFKTSEMNTETSNRQTHLL